MSFATGLESFGDQPALLLADGESISYRALADRADALFADPAAPRERTPVAIACTNSPQAIAVYLGALRAGFPALLLDAGLDAALAESLCAHFGIAWTCDHGQWRRRAVTPPAVHADLALLLSTSGSTGSRKLVRLALANLQTNAESIVDFLGITARERPITVLPMHYSYGLSVINSHLAVGATIILSSEPVTARGFWRQIQAQGATSLSGVPATYAMLRRMRLERMDLPTLKALTQAGGRLGPDDVRWFAQWTEDTGRRFFVMYGQTEATARIAYVPPASLPAKAAAIGIAIPGGALELIGDDGQPVTANEVAGELHYRGPNVMMGYADGAACLALGDLRQGRLATGDLAWRDGDGYYHLAGRRNRFIKVFGNRIGLDEVEAQLQADGHDVAVTGEDDRLMIALRGDYDCTALGRAVSIRYRLHGSAIQVTRVDDFPRSAAGKVQYTELLSRLAARIPAASHV